MTAADVVLYATSCGGTLKVKSDIARIKNLLDVKRVQYEEVDLSMEPERREAMLVGSQGVRLLPQLHVNRRYVGTADDIQELEDWGELSGILQGLTPEEAGAAAAAAAAAGPAFAAPIAGTAAVAAASPAVVEAAGPGEAAAPAPAAEKQAVRAAAAEVGPVQAEEDFEALASGLVAAAVAGALAAASAAEQQQQQQEEQEGGAAASRIAAAAVASALSAAAAEERLAAAVAASLAEFASGSAADQEGTATELVSALLASEPAAAGATEPAAQPAAARPSQAASGRSAAAAAAVAAIQASAADIIDRALRAGERLYPEPQQAREAGGEARGGDLPRQWVAQRCGDPCSAAEAVAALQLEASSLPSPDANTPNLLCSPLKLRPELSQLARQQ